MSMNIDQFKEQIRDRWKKTSLLSGNRKSNRDRLTPFAKELLEAICRRVSADKQESLDMGQTDSEADQQASKDLKIFATWDGWDKPSRLIWDQLQDCDSIDEAVVELYRLLVKEIKTDEAIAKWGKPQPSESDLEDAYNTLLAITFKGSPKQIAWAEKIAIESRVELAILWKNGVLPNLPTQAAWWIDHRHDIATALRLQQHL